MSDLELRSAMHWLCSDLQQGWVDSTVIQKMGDIVLELVARELAAKPKRRRTVKRGGGR